MKHSSCGSANGSADGVCEGTRLVCDLFEWLAGNGRKGYVVCSVYNVGL